MKNMWGPIMLAIAVAAMFVGMREQNETERLIRDSSAEAKIGTWRAGFKAGYQRALEMDNWTELREWSNLGRTAGYLRIRKSHATTLAGNQTTYYDTFAAGYSDAQISISEEMYFIQTRNAGDEQHFYNMTIDWIKMNDTDRIIPPGHF